MNVSELSRQNIEKFGEHDSLYFNGRWYTNREMLVRSAGIAEGLRGLGVQRGDRVALMLSNCPEVLNTFSACFAIGAWCMPVLFSLTAAETRFVLQDAEPTVVITERQFLDKVREAAGGVQSIHAIVTADAERIEGTVGMGDWLKNPPAQLQPVSCAPDDVALLMYTSGTTGQPKGVMLSHDNLLFTAVSSSRARDIRAGEIFLSCLPLNHSYGIILFISSEYYGIRNVLLKRFDVEDVLRHIEEFRCSAASLVPTMILRMVGHPAAGKYDLSSIRRWASASAPLPLELRRRFEEKFPGRLIEAYGLTECSPTVAMERMSMPARDCSVGLVIDGVEVSIQDARDNILPRGETGEICVRGRNLMQGYYKRPEATAAMIRNGWLHTGDVGRLDRDGYLYVTDRIKDMIIRGGENIYPKDIEDVILTHDKVEEVAVIGMPDVEWGEVAMAVVVPRAGQSIGVEEIVEHCRGPLGKFQVPVRVEFAESLPKSSIGKLLKRELRKKYFG